MCTTCDTPNPFPPVTNDLWCCQTCTYHNTIDLPRCEMCEMPNPSALPAPPKRIGPIRTQDDPSFATHLNLSSQLPPDVCPSLQLRAMGVWSRKNAGESYQWCGWQAPQQNGHWVRLSCFIRFHSQIPPPSHNFGLKINGQTCNDWLDGLEPNTWKFVSAVAPVIAGEDFDYHLLIFDSIPPGPQIVAFGGLSMEVFDRQVAAAESWEEVHQSLPTPAYIPAQLENGAMPAQPTPAVAQPTPAVAQPAAAPAAPAAPIEVVGQPLLVTAPKRTWGPSALVTGKKYSDGHGGRGRAVWLGPSPEAMFFVQKPVAGGAHPGEVHICLADDNSIRLTSVLAEDTLRLHLWHSGQPNWPGAADTFRFIESKSIWSKEAVHLLSLGQDAGSSTTRVVGVDAENQIILVQKDDKKRRLQFVVGQQLQDMCVALKKRQANMRQMWADQMRLNDNILDEDTLRTFKEKGFMRLRGLVHPKLVQSAMQQINKSLAESNNKDLFKAKTFDRHPAVTDLFNASGIPEVLMKLLGCKKPPRQGAGQLALRFPGDACRPGRQAPPGHLNGHRKHWHIDGCPNNFIKGMTDHYGKIRNFDCLIGVLLSPVRQPLSGELCCYPGSHDELSDYFRTDNNLKDVAKTGKLPTGGATDNIFKHKPEACLGEPGDVFMANYMTAHFIAPNTSTNIRYAVYFRTSGPHFREMSDFSESMLQPWRNWPLMGGMGIAKTKTKKEKFASLKNVLRSRTVANYYLTVDNTKNIHVQI